jgi:hypothetical protein
MTDYNGETRDGNILSMREAEIEALKKELFQAEDVRAVIERENTNLRNLLRDMGYEGTF